LILTSVEASRGEGSGGIDNRYIEIFGDKTHDGNSTLANQVILDFCANYPDGKCGPSRKKRGEVSLTSYTHTSGKKVARVQKSSTYKLDYEAFVGKMKFIRNWNPVKADGEWKKLDVPDNFADNKGPAEHPRRHVIVTMPGELRPVLVQGVGLDWLIGPVVCVVGRGRPRRKLPGFAQSNVGHTRPAVARVGPPARRP
jgi:hypothetical protein